MFVYICTYVCLPYSNDSLRCVEACSMTRLGHMLRNDTFTCVEWLIHMWDTIHSSIEWYDTCTYLTWLTHTYLTWLTHTYLTWLFHMGDENHSFDRLCRHAAAHTLTQTTCQTLIDTAAHYNTCCNARCNTLQHTATPYTATHSDRGESLIWQTAHSYCNTRCDAHRKTHCRTLQRIL